MRRARAGALAEQVDAAVAERTARGLEVVDALDERVAGEVDAVGLQPVGAVARRRASYARRATRAEEVGGALRADVPRGSRAPTSRRRRDSRRARRRGRRRTGSPRRTPCSSCPGPPSSRKIGSRRVRGARVDAGDGQRRSAGSRVARFSGTTSVPQSAARRRPRWRSRRASRIRWPACAPAGTETARVPGASQTRTRPSDGVHGDDRARATIACGACRACVSGSMPATLRARRGARRRRKAAFRPPPADDPHLLPQVGGGRRGRWSTVGS